MCNQSYCSAKIQKKNDTKICRSTKEWRIEIFMDTFEFVAVTTAYIGCIAAAKA